MPEGEVFFCHLCGKRLADEDLDEGRAYREGNRYFCTTCPKAVRRPRPAPRAAPSPMVQPAAPRRSRMVWVLAGAAVAAGIVAVVFVELSGGPASAPRRRTEKKEPPPEVEARGEPRAVPAPRREEQVEPPSKVEVHEEPRALPSTRRPLGGGGGGGDEEAVDFRTEGARIAYEAALAHRRENPTDMQGYIGKLFVVTERYSETDYAEKARKAVPAPIPGEWMWWVVSGFDNSDKKGLSRPFPPEESPASVDASATYQGKEGVLRWREVKCREFDGFVDMKKVFGHKYVVAYGFTYLHSDGDQPALLGVGSDDCVKVWLNGRVVLERDEYRRWKRDENKVRITLKRGANPLLLKLTQASGGYMFSVTVRGEKSCVRIVNEPRRH